MNYLERNAQLIREVEQSLILGKKREVGRSGRMIFRTLGSYQSELLGQEVFVGLKIPPKKDRSNFVFDYLLRGRFTIELAIINAIAEGLPQLTPELPAFYGLLVNRWGRARAIITEDFSQSKRYWVSEMGKPARELEELFQQRIGEYELRKVSFWIKGLNLRRLGDFNTLLDFETTDKLKESAQLGMEDDLTGYSLHFALRLR